MQLSPTKIGLGLALLVSALVVLFLFTARAVTIETSPPASLKVSGGLSFKLAEHYLLLQGDYQLSAEAEGYYPLQESFAVGEAQNQIRRFELKKLPGHLTVDTGGIDATIWIDDQEVGQSNTELRDIEAGEHRLRVEAPRYQRFEQSLSIEGLDRSQTQSVELQRAWANVGFTSTPAGAELFADGESLGTTPIQAQLLEGNRQLMLKLPGHKAWQENFDITAQDDFDLPGITLDPADGLVMVKTQPSGAGITVNGTYRGQSPFELNLPPGAEYQIAVFKDGYSRASRSLTVTSGKEQSLQIKLSPELGDVRIKSKPEDALLYIDGRLMGRANQTLTLPSKQHQVTISKEGYVDYNTVVLPRPGIAQAVSARLLTLEEDKWKNIKPMITTAAGSELKLFKVDAEFSMGASRREQGRRSNEAIRKVSLSRAFYLGVSEVTNAQYRKFIKHHSSGHVKGNSLNGEQQPVVNLTWDQAALYCNWLSEQESLPPFYQIENDAVTGFNPQSNGYRLPTEAEWSWAARLQKDGTMLKYAWGKTLPPAEKSTNIGDRRAAALLGHIQVSYDDGYAVTAPVKQFPANEKGLYDLDGNVAEWVNDYYGIKTGLSRAAEMDPTGPAQGDHHVIRGSSWSHGSVTDLRLSFRDYGIEGRYDLGFRVARFVD